jgi:hypothetical protein
MRDSIVGDMTEMTAVSNVWVEVSSNTTLFYEERDAETGQYLGI